MSARDTASPLSEERVREYEQMLAAVTPGPWRVRREPRRLSAEGKAAFEGLTPPPSVVVETVADDPQLHRPYEIFAVAFSSFCEPPTRIAIDDNDARFIAASPTIVAALLADRARLSARVAELERELTEARA